MSEWNDKIFDKAWNRFSESFLKDYERTWLEKFFGSSRKERMQEHKEYFKAGVNYGIWAYQQDQHDDLIKWSKEMRENDKSRKVK